MKTTSLSTQHPRPGQAPEAFGTCATRSVATERTSTSAVRERPRGTDCVTVIEGAP